MPHLVVDRLTTPVAALHSQMTESIGIHITASHSRFDFIGVKFLNGGVQPTVREEEQLKSYAVAATNASNHPATDSAPFGLLDRDALWANYAEKLRLSVGRPLPQISVEVRHPWVSDFARYFPEFNILGRSEVDASRLAPIETKEATSDLLVRLDEDADQGVLWRGSVRVPGHHLLYGIAQVIKTGAVVSFDTPARTVRRLISRKRELHLCPVGDQYVAEAMVSNGLFFGGEPNGHIIDRSWLLVPDGLRSGILAAGNPPHWLPLLETEPVARLAYMLESDQRKELQRFLDTAGFTNGYLMWEKVTTGSSRCLVRFSQYEETVVVQLEGDLSDDLLPSWLASCESETLSV